MDQTEKVAAFKALHQRGMPVVLYNIWDAGSAKVLAEAGAQAVATGSWSVAAAQGYGDGEQIPLDTLLLIAGRITASVSVPVTIDFEGGYARDAATLSANVARLIGVGAVGLNFEDQIVGGQGIYAQAEQASRIAAVRKAGDIFINARTDLFLKAPAADHAGQIDEALRRADAYAKVGADGFFVPGLGNPDLIRRVCADAALPVNVMMLGNPASIAEVAAMGAGRLSYGPGPCRVMLADLKARFQALA